MIPVVMEVHVQKGLHDCGVSALATFSGIPNRVVSEKALALFPTVHKSGLWATDLAKLARSMGVHLVRAKHPDPKDSDDTGLLVLRKADGTSHITTLFQGVLIDPASGLLYDLSTYLDSKKYSIRAFLAPKLSKKSQ